MVYCCARSILRATFVALALSFLAEANHPAITSHKVKNQHLPASYKCPEGYSINGTLCVSTIREPPKALCKMGTLEGDLCVQEYDIEPDCPPNFMLFETRKNKQWKTKHFTNDHFADEPNAQCSRTLTASPLPSCPAGYILDGLSCHKSSFLQPTCPSGTVETTDGRCARYAATSKRCPTGYTSPVDQYNPFAKESSRCSRVNRVAAQETCLDGYSLAGDVSQCEKVTMLDPVCMPGSVDAGLPGCAVYTPLQRRCPDRFSASSSHHKSASVCSRVLTNDPFPVCNEEAGYVLNFATNQCDKLNVLPLVCPANTQEVNGTCMQYSPATPVCADGFVLSGDGSSCIRTESLLANAVCSVDYVVEDDRCVKTVANPLVCPHGTIEDAENGNCVRYTASQSECPIGFEMQQLSHTASIHSKASKLHKKKSTEALSNDRCVRVESVAAVASCSKEFVSADVDGMCEKTLTTPAELICETGARDGDKCLEYKLVEPIFICPEEYVYEGGRCVKPVDYDCSTVQYVTQCRQAPACVGKECEMEYLNRNEKAHKLRSLFVVDDKSRESKYKLFGAKFDGEHDLNKFEKFDGEHDLKEKFDKDHEKVKYFMDHKQSPPQLCEQVLVPQQKVCQKQLYADAMKECPAGTEVQGSGCVERVSRVMMFKCFDGMTLQGSQCAKTLRKPAQYECPEGFTMTTSSHHSSFKSKHFNLSPSRSCVSTVEAPMQYNCVEGVLIEGNRCASYFPKECPNGQCERRVVMRANYECPPNFDVEWNTCTYTQELPVNYLCAEGQLQSQGAVCGMTYPKECPEGGCEITISVAPSYECQEGYFLTPEGHHVATKLQRKGKSHSSRVQTCTATETTPFDVFCPEGTMLEGDTCVKFVPKACPNGECQRISKKSINYECPVGFQLESRDHVWKAKKQKQHHLKSKRASQSEELDLEDAPASASCTFTEFADFQQYCTSGDLDMSGDRCVSYSQKRCQNGNCEIVHSVGTSTVCPDGYQMPPSSQWKGNHHSDVVLCQSVEVVAATYRCEKGLMDPSGTKCLKMFNVDYECLGGGVMQDDGSCEITKYENPMAMA